MNTIFGSVADPSFRGNTTNRNINKHCKLTRKIVLTALLMAGTIFLIASSVEANAQITLAHLAGPWQIALVGNTGCGQSSLLFTGSMNASGTAPGFLSGSSTGCPSSNNIAETFTINSLDSHGSGTASLSCGTFCGWNFQIQVASNEQTFNLVDTKNGGNNVLAGTAVSQSAPAITLDQLAGTWQIGLVGNTACGRTSVVFNGQLSTSGQAIGALTDTSGCSFSNPDAVFRITSLSLDGSGTASLSCPSGCGWNFDIQVAPNKQTFNLVDVADGSSAVLAGSAVVSSNITLNQLLAEPWTIALTGNTGCGQTSMLFTETALDPNSGNPTGILSATSSGCPSGSSTQTFSISPLSNGNGTATLSCGSGCGWNFAIQLSPDGQVFNLVDTKNFGTNVLAGTAVARPGLVAVPDETGNPVQAAEADIQAAGLKWRLSGSGAWVLSTKPSGGTFVPIGSTVTIFRTNIHN